MDEGSVIVQLASCPRSTWRNRPRSTWRCSALKAVPEVADVIARTGSDELGLDPMGLNETDSFVVLKPRANGAATRISWWSSCAT
jgi:cobalt-zinc-cadmium resistance protein CzcA